MRERVCGVTWSLFLREWWWPWKGPTHVRGFDKFVLAKRWLETSLAIECVHMRNKSSWRFYSYLLHPQGNMLFLQNLPTHNWGNKDISLLVAEAYQFKYMFADAPRHLNQQTKRWLETSLATESVHTRDKSCLQWRWPLESLTQHTGDKTLHRLRLAIVIPAAVSVNQTLRVCGTCDCIQLISRSACKVTTAPLPKSSFRGKAVYSRNVHCDLSKL